MPSTQPRQTRRTKYKLREPSQYHVILHNDDTTTMEFVVSLLVSVFRKSRKEAESLMMKVHEEGSGVAGTYSRDIAESKQQKAVSLARANNFPLKITIEEA